MRQARAVSLAKILNIASHDEEETRTLYCRSMASLGSSLIFGLFLIFFARFAYLIHNATELRMRRKNRGNDARATRSWSDNSGIEVNLDVLCTNLDGHVSRVLEKPTRTLFGTFLGAANFEKH